MKRLVYLMALIGGCLSASGGPGPLPGSQRVNPAFNASDVVCYCRVRATEIVRERVEVVDERQVKTRQMRAFIEIRDLYKGSIEPSSSPVRVLYEEEIPASRIISPSVAVGDDAIMFFITDAAGTYKFIDPFIGATRISGLSAQFGGDGIIKLRTALEQVLEIKDRVSQLAAMRMLQGIDPVNPALTTALAKLAIADDTEVAAEAIALWLKIDPAVAIQTLYPFMKEHGRALDGIQLANLATQLGTITDGDAVVPLEQLTSSGVSSIRYGAVYALRHLRSTHSYPIFVRLLDDPDLNISYQAVAALAETTGKTGDYGPNMQVFQGSPQRYIRLWKLWWSEYSSTKGPSQ